MPRRKVQRNTHKRSVIKETPRTRKTITIQYPIGQTVFPQKRLPKKQLATTTRRVASSDLSKRTPPRTVVRQEKAAIRQNRVRPILSKISPLSCQKKRKIARHEYLSMRAAGRGATIKSIINPERFTVRCN